VKPSGPRSVGATFVTLGLAYGVWYAYSVFLVALLREFGWSRSLVAGAFSTFTLVHGLVSPALGWLADRVGPRRLVLAGGATLAAGLLLDGSVSRPWHLYLAFGLVTALGVAAAGWVPAVLLVQRWFPHRVGTALGLTSAGIGVGIFVMGPLSQWLIALVGWRWAFRIIGVLAGGWIVPAALWLVSDPPAVPATGAVGAAPVNESRDREARRLGRSARGVVGHGGRREPPTRAEPARATAGAAPADEVTLATALRSARFWLLALGQLCTAFVNQLLLVHQVAYLVDHGIPVLVAASVVGVVGAASVVGKAGGGWCSDRIGREITFTLGMGLAVLSLGALGMVALTRTASWAYAYGLLIGVGYSITAPLLPALLFDYYRGRHFGSIFGTLHVANAVGGSLGPWLGGRAFDLTGGYAPALVAAGVAAAVATVALWVARGGRRPRG
jgi:MFS family permease